MKEDLKALAKDLKKFLKAAQEEDFTLKAAPVTVKAAAFSHELKDETMPKKKSADIEVKATTAVKAAKAAKTPAMPPEEVIDKKEFLDQLAQHILTCKRCDLGETRIKAVPGEGNINAKLMFVGEGPGYEEDRQGRPFVGRAGQLLDKIIAAMGFTREEVFIANMVKCHPMVDPSDPEKRANDRAPRPDEIAVCRRYVEQQINAIAPDYVVALGGVAAKSLIMDAPSLAAIRGKLYNLQLATLDLKKPVKILATYHPAALLRNPGWKKDAWADLKVLLADMGREPLNIEKGS